VAQLVSSDALIPLTIPEVRRLVYRLVVRILAPPEAVLHWSRWRRRHQARAMRSHYRHRPARAGWAKESPSAIPGVMGTQ
jgi:hypothetical protein